MKKILVSILTLISISALAQCPAHIEDKANVLKNLNLSQLNALSNQGADPYVLTTNSTVLPEQLVSNIRNECTLWQSPSGGVKNNLIVYVLEPVNHKFGIFYGSEWKPALDDHASSIKMQFMAPAFRDHDWDRGFLNGINQTSNQIKAFQEVSAHPNQTVVQPTDFSGFWTFLYWLLGLSVFAFLGWAVYYAFENKGKNKDAKQKAVQAKNDAADSLIKTKNWLDEKTALGENVKSQQAGYDAYAEQFARAASTEAYNPESRSSTGQYETIAAHYSDISRRLVSCRNVASSWVDSTTPKPRTNKRVVVQRPPSQTVIVHDSPVIVPVIIDESPRYSAPDPRPSFTSSDNSFSGSSSSYDSSSSWSDSSSSSDFSSGGSDFSGSSSDF